MSIAEDLVRRWSGSRMPLPGTEPARIAARHLLDASLLAEVGIRTVDGREVSGALGVDDDLSSGRSAAVFGAIGAAIRLTEADDIDLPSCMTPGAAVVPGVLAALRDAPASGADAVVRGLTLGYDVMSVLGAALGGPLLVNRGVWPSLALGGLGAAVAYAAARGCDDETLAEAVLGAFAASPVPFSPRAGAGRSVRWVVFAGAIASGIAAGRAALAGLRADSTIPARVLHGIAGDEAVARAAEALDATAVDPWGRMSMKPYSCGRQSLAAVDAMQRILRREGVAADDIEGILVRVPGECAGFIDRPVPFRDRRATLGVQYQLALAILEPRGLYDCERATARHDASFVRLASTVAIAPDDELTRRFPERWGASVEVSAGGEVFRETVLDAKGDPGERLTLAEVIQKGELALQMTSGSTQRQAREVVDRVRSETAALLALQGSE